MFSSEVDPFADVKLDIDGFETPNKPKGEGKALATVRFQGAKFSLQELKEMQDTYMAEAKRLQQEVIELGEELEEEHVAALHIPSSTLQALRDILKIKKAEDGMKNMHKMQASLSGVHLTDATTEVTSNNPDRIVRRQRLEGSCSGLGFAATFEVEETVTQKEDEEADDDGAASRERRRAVVSKLDLEVDPQCLVEMTPFLTEVERRCDLQPFLRGYAEYAMWFQHRSRAFTHFKKEHTEAVSLPEGPGGTVLQVSAPNQKGIIYAISWRIDLADSGKATPHVTLTVKSVPEVTTLDTRKTLHRAPGEFSNMVETMGVEKALDTFLRAVSLR